MLKRIGAEESGEFKAVASGTLPSGRPVIVNADGTVSAVSSPAVSQALGSAQVFESAATSNHNAAYDSHNQRVVLAYRDGGNSNRGTAIVGTVNANNTITYGTAVVFETGSTDFINVLFDSTNNKIVIIFRDVGDSNKAKGIVGTVDPSDNSISFGSASSGFASSTVDELSATYTTGGKVVAAYRDTHNSNYGNANVGTVSGTSITFGSSDYFEGGAVDKTSVGYDTANDKVLFFYIDAANSDYPTAIVGTISGTTLSYGTAVVVKSAAANISVAQAYDTDQQKFGLFYKAQSEGQAAVATISGTSVSVSLKTPLAAFENNAPRYISAVYHQAAKKIVVAYEDDGDSFKGKIALPKISGTNMLDPDGTMPSSGGQGSPVIFDTSSLTEKLDVVYDSVNKKAVIAYSDGGNSEHGTSVVFGPAYDDQNITSENYIGMSRGVAFKGGAVGAVGTAVVYESASTSNTDVGFDSSNNKIVVVYRDGGDSDNGKAVVGTVDNSDNSITFGTPVTFNSGRADNPRITFDSANNKVVIIYSDYGSSGQGTALVGTVSGTSISFGSEVRYETGRTDWNAVTFDSANNKVVVTYQDLDDSDKGKAAVGTVSGTSISFGSPVVFEADNAQYMAATFDSTNDKVVIAYRNNTDTAGNAIVGTVSGTSISFGTAAVYSTDNVRDQGIAFDPNEGKVVVTFRDEGASNKGTAVVGTVSGTGISFGSKVVYFSTRADQNDINYNSVDKKFTITFIDDSGTPVKAIGVKISGTSLDVDDDILTVDADASATPRSAYDANANRIVVAFTDSGNSSYGTAAVVKSNTIATTRGEVASGQAASVDIIGSVSDNQIGLTAGQQYFVQADGTISETAASPSVLAGTAISATELVVKT
jgi:hypothetical protein